MPFLQLNMNVTLPQSIIPRPKKQVLIWESTLYSISFIPNFRKGAVTPWVLKSITARIRVVN